MAQSWPGTLPQALQVNDLKGSFADLQTQFIPDHGPPILRRWGTADYEPLSGSMVMTTAQLADLKTFWKSYCASEIIFPNPFGGSSLTVVFVAKPDWQWFAPGNYRVTLQFKVKP